VRRDAERGGDLPSRCFERLAERRKRLAESLQSSEKRLLGYSAPEEEREEAAGLRERAWEGLARGELSGEGFSALQGPLVWREGKRLVTSSKRKISSTSGRGKL